MSVPTVLAAVDLGAESGRVLACRFTGDRLDIAEVHRFPNRPVQLLDSLHWNVLHLYQGIVEGLRKAASSQGRIRSVGVDSWGLDFDLVGQSGQLVSNPVYYRDRRADEVMDEVHRLIPPREIFAETGIPLIPVSALYRLCAAATRTPELVR